MANKNFITIPTDRHGTPALITDHLSACGEYHGPWWSSKVDALDYYGHWRPFDALCDAAFYGRNRAVALGNTPQQRFMGRWSDGLPVNELVVGEP